MRILAGPVLFIAALCSATVAEAARVTPMSAELSPTGRNSSTRIEVTNSEDRDLPMEIRMYKGTISEQGELDLQPADEDFVAFPPQVVIKPNSQQIFRVQYLPGEPLSQSQVYYAAISQIPVELDANSSMIQVVMRFNVLLNIVPDGAKADPVISYAKTAVRYAPPTEEEAIKQKAADGQTEKMPAISKAAADTGVATAAEDRSEKGIEVRIENRGTRFFAAGRTGWKITGTASDGTAFSKSYTPSEIGGEIGMGVVPPAGARIFFLKMDEDLQGGTVNITLDI